METFKDSMPLDRKERPEYEALDKAEVANINAIALILAPYLIGIEKLPTNILLDYQATGTAMQCTQTST